MARAAFVSFGFFAYPRDFIVEKSRAVYDGLCSRGLTVTYFGPVLEVEDANRINGEMSAGSFDFIIAHVTTWAMTPPVVRVLREFSHKPILVWGMGGTTVNGTLVSPASPAGTSALLYPLRQLGIRHRFVYDHPDAEPKYDEVLAFARVVDAVRSIDGSRIGAMGSYDMGLYALMIDQVALKRQLGMDVEDIFSHEIAKLADEAPAGDVGAVIDEMNRHLRFGQEPPRESLEKTARLTVALRRKVAERGYLGVTMKCVHGVSRHMGFTPCVTQALLSKDVSSICESDIAGLATEVVLRKISGSSSTFMEHYEYYPDAILVGVCGFVPFDMAVEPRVKCMCAGWGGFTGLYETPEIRTGAVTVARLYSENGALKMLLLKAEAAPPPRWAELGWTDPMPQFPGFLMRPACTVDAYVNAVPAQHVNIVYGDWTAQVRDFCMLTGVDVVAPA